MERNSRSLWIILAVLGGIVLLGPLLGGGMMGAGMMGPGMMGGSGMTGGSGMMGGSGGSGWGWGLAMGLGGLATLAFWGALIVGAVLLLRRLGAPSATTGSAGGEAALDILRRRYASGELTREQYEQMRRDLHDEAP